MRVSPGTLGCLHPVPLLSSGETHSSTGSMAGLPKTRETGTDWSKTSKGCKDGEGLEHQRCEEGLGELLSLEIRGLGGGWWLMEGRHEGAKALLAVPRDRRPQGHMENQEIPVKHK